MTRTSTGQEKNTWVCLLAQLCVSSINYDLHKIITYRLSHFIGPCLAQVFLTAECADIFIVAEIDTRGRLSNTYDQLNDNFKAIV